jgi:cleavage stimulation factor subunit 3
MGPDFNSNQIWIEYIELLKSFKFSNQFDQSQNDMKIRKHYQTAIQQPINNLEQLWNDYEIFETNLSPQLVILYS